MIVDNLSSIDSTVKGSHWDRDLDNFGDERHVVLKTANSSHVNSFNNNSGVG